MIPFGTIVQIISGFYAGCIGPVTAVTDKPPYYYWVRAECTDSRNNHYGMHDWYPEKILKIVEDENKK